ncbi:hypothetical protein NONI108955_40470 [Nocardia ninae]
MQTGGEGFAGLGRRLGFGVGHLLDRAEES